LKPARALFDPKAVGKGADKEARAALRNVIDPDQTLVI
jgi:hypothetical protein